MTRGRNAPAGKNFNPLRPRGRRHRGVGCGLNNIQFQPTPPARTETLDYRSRGTGRYISTHSAREDGDRRKRYASRRSIRFQPTPPARTETFLSSSKVKLSVISTHSAREDGDHTATPILSCFTYFNPLRPRGRRHLKRNTTDILIYFNPLRPRGRRQQYYTKKPTILHHISTIKSHHTPSNHRQPTLHTSKTVLIVQFFRCESPRKFMFASGSHQTI